MITVCRECQNLNKAENTCSAHGIPTLPDTPICKKERERRMILDSILDGNGVPA